jgi:hypothetical protein
MDLLDTVAADAIIVYSCGIGKNISFDRELLRRYKNIQIFGFDPTPIASGWIKSQKLPGNYHFFQTGVSSQKGMEKMYLPKSHSESYIAYNIPGGGGG